jgi:transposase-like protein
MVNAGAMKSSNGFPRHRRRRTPPSRRTQLLAAFDRSGLSAAAFARQHGIGYSTFCGWRHRWAKTKALPTFVEVEVPGPAAAVELLIEVGAHARLRISSAGQVELAARFLHHLNALTSC